MKRQSCLQHKCTISRSPPLQLTSGQLTHQSSLSFPPKGALERNKGFNLTKSGSLRPPDTYRAQSAVYSNIQEMAVFPFQREGKPRHNRQAPALSSARSSRLPHFWVPRSRPQRLTFREAELPRLLPISRMSEQLAQGHRMNPGVLSPGPCLTMPSYCL